MSVLVLVVNAWVVCDMACKATPNALQAMLDLTMWHGACRASEAHQQVLRDVTNVQGEKSLLLRELEALRSRFQQYQTSKAHEVAVLEQRIKLMLQQLPIMPDGVIALPESITKAGLVSAAPWQLQGDGGTDDGELENSENCPEAGSCENTKVDAGAWWRIPGDYVREVAMGIESEAIATAMREVEFERLQGSRLEK